jgi:hypothetical protein
MNKYLHKNSILQTTKSILETLKMTDSFHL